MPRRLGFPARTVLLLTLGWALGGCFAYSNVHRDTDDRPVVTTGVGATILDPGQPAPPLPPPPWERPGGHTGAPAPRAGTSGGSAAAGAPREVLIGGTSVEDVRHVELRQEPLWLKPLLLPFAVVAWPFKKVAEAVRGTPEPPVSRPAAKASPGPYDIQAAHEEAELERMRRELAARGSGAASPPATPARSTTPAAPTAGGSVRSSIAAELAALRTGAPIDGGSGGHAPPTRSRSELAPAGVADRVLDDDGDGRPDHWIYRDGGRVVREVFDAEGDGIPNRTLYYEEDAGSPTRVEEDLNGDGRVDSWQEYREGKPVRRRMDSDGNGFVDSWTFFRGGVPLRHEQDTDGNGFRDRIGYYEAGSLQREEEDLDGDGRPDRISYFDDQGRVVQLDEDADGDGEVDRRSFYENGRLVRRELLSEAAVRSLERESANPPPLPGEPRVDG